MSYRRFTLILNYINLNYILREQAYIHQESCTCISFLYPNPWLLEWWIDTYIMHRRIDYQMYQKKYWIWATLIFFKRKIRKWSQWNTFFNFDQWRVVFRDAKDVFSLKIWITFPCCCRLRTSEVFVTLLYLSVHFNIPVHWQKKGVLNLGV